MLVNAYKIGFSSWVYEYTPVTPGFSLSRQEDFWVKNILRSCTTPKSNLGTWEEVAGLGVQSQPRINSKLQINPVSMSLKTRALWNRTLIFSFSGTNISYMGNFRIPVWCCYLQSWKERALWFGSVAAKGTTENMLCPPRVGNEGPGEVSGQWEGKTKDGRQLTRFCFPSGQSPRHWSAISP